MKHKQLRVVERAFALPTILIASVIMMVVLVSAVTAVSSTSSLLSSQYYNQLARHAAEAGLAYARDCLITSGYETDPSTTWNNTNQLRPDRACNGTTTLQNSAEKQYIQNGNNVRTTFRVGAPTTGAGGTIHITARGIVELTRSSNGSVWRTFETTLAQTSRYNDAPQIAGGAGWKENGHNGYMLSAGGTLYGWGDNEYQQLGSISELGTAVSKPVEIAPPAGATHVRTIANSGQGATILCVIATMPDRGDQVYCRGAGGGGGANVLAGGSWNRFGLATGLRAVDVVVNGFGTDNICVRATDLQVYCVGENVNGQLGKATTDNSYVTMGAPTKFRLDLANPGPTSGSAADLTVKRLYAQDAHVCVIASDDNAYCAGRNDGGQLGRGNTSTGTGNGNPTPGRALIPDTTVQSLVLGYHNGSSTITYLGTNNYVYMSGPNNYGTAADSSTNGTVYSTPRRITGRTYSKLFSIGQEGNGLSTICAAELSENVPNSGAWCMGSNTYGQVGNKNCTNQNFWQGWLDLGGETVSKNMPNEMTYQMNTTMMITTEGNVWAWGDNRYGKLGTGASSGACNSTPAKVALPNGVKAITLTATDEYTAYILGNDGNVYAMGRNHEGQLGDGTTTQRNSPVKVDLPRQEIVY